MNGAKEVSSEIPRNWLEAGKEVSILDGRLIQERSEWFIPGSIYFNAYDKLKAYKPDALHGLHLDKKIPVVTVCAAGKTSSIAKLLANEDKKRSIVIYCGCCPFKDCPNIRPAFSWLNEMKFINHKILNLPHNLKMDWINHGFPMSK